MVRVQQVHMIQGTTDKNCNQKTKKNTCMQCVWLFPQTITKIGVGGGLPVGGGANCKHHIA